MANALVKRGVRTTHAGYDDFVPKWQRARDVCAGQDAVHGAGEKYLPKLKDQSKEDYGAYVMRAAFVNYSWRTVAALNGMLFRKEPKLEVPARVKDYLNDVTQTGTSLQSFAQEIGEEQFVTSRCGILVDFPLAPATTAPLTIANATELGLRPTMQMYNAESIINWKFRNIRNKNVLSMVVLKEVQDIPLDEFGDKQEDRYRVLELDPATDTYRIRVFKVEDEKDIELSNTIPLMDGKALTEIPFYFITPDGLCAELDEPALIDLFDLNLSHYRTNADYEHACHFTGLPTPWITGYNNNGGFAEGDAPPAALYVGSASAWIFPEPTTKVGYLEFEGRGLDALVSNKEAKEQAMAMLGARMLTGDKAGVEAFKTVAIRNNGETSILSSIALSLSIGIKAALTMFAKWAGADGTIEFEINRDFLPAAMDPQSLTAYLALVQGGQMSQESFFDLLQRGDVIDGELTFEQEQARIDANPLPKPAAPAAPVAKPPAKAAA